MPEGEVAGGTQPDADWIKQNLDKEPFVLALRPQEGQKPLVIAVVRRTLPPRHDDGAA